MEIAQDNEITVEESQRWCDNVEALLGEDEETGAEEEPDE